MRTLKNISIIGTILINKINKIIQRRIKYYISYQLLVMLRKCRVLILVLKILLKLYLYLINKINSTMIMINKI